MKWKWTVKASEIVQHLLVFLRTNCASPALPPSPCEPAAPQTASESGAPSRASEKKDRTWLTWCDLKWFHNDLLMCNPFPPKLTLKSKKTWFGCGFTFKGCLIWGGWDYLVCLEMGVEKRKSVKCKSFFPIDLVQCAALCCILRAHCRLQHEVPALTWRPRQLARPWCIHPKTVGTQHPPHPCSYATASTKSSNMRSYR